MSASRAPKPSLAPKPKVTPELNGNQRGCINSGPLISDGTVNEEHDTEHRLYKMVAARLPAAEQLNAYILKSSPKDGGRVLCGVEDGNVTEEVKEQEEDVIQKMDEDWRLTDSALTEETDSLETLWVSDAGLTADSEEVVEMGDTDMTEDMDAEGCDAGEALADTDGLSVGDISVNSIGEVPGCLSVGNHHMKKRREKLRKKEDETGDCTADDLTESLTEEPVFIDTKTQVRGERKDKVIRNISKPHGKNLQNIVFCSFTPKHQEPVCDTSENHGVEDDQTHEPYYVSSEDIINREMMPRSNTAHDPTQSPLTPQKLLSFNSSEVSFGKYVETAENGQSSEDYAGIANNGYSCDNSDAIEARQHQKWVTVKTEELKAQMADALLNHLDCQPRLRLVSISVPTDSNTSLTSLSERQLLSPSGSEISDLEGHIVPFLDDTTDTEQDISEEHVYEDPGHSSEGENIFPFDKRSPQIHRSLSKHLNNNAAGMGVQFAPRPYMSGFEQPALSSSPMLNSKQKTYPKPLYLSRYPRSISMEGQDTSLGVYSYMEGSPRQGGAICSSSGSFSRSSALSSSGLSTPTSVMDIPPPFELAYITKKPITKSSPLLFTDGDSSEKHRKNKSSIKRFLMLKFRRKADSKQADVSPSSHHMPSRLLDLDRHSLSSSPQLSSRSASNLHVSPEPVSKFLYYKDNKRKGNSVAFLNRSVVRVESFEDRSRVPFTPLPLTKPRSISFPNTDTSDYENVPVISSDYENLQVPQRRPVPQPQVPFADFFDRPGRVLSSANETDGYVDMSSLPGFKSKIPSPDQETERYGNKTVVMPCWKICEVELECNASMINCLR